MKINDEEIPLWPFGIAEQVSNYDTIPFWKSARGQAVTILLLYALHLAGSTLKAMDLTALLNAVVYGVLAFCIYRAQRWAIVVAMLLFTAERGIGIWELPAGARDGGFLVFMALLWAGLLYTLYKAFVVEQVRQNIRTMD